MNNQRSGKERRKFKRVKVSFTVLYRVDSPIIVRMRVGDKVFNAIALDLSKGGMAVLTDYNVPLSTIIIIDFIMLDATSKQRKSIKVQGEVRYNLSTEEGAYRLGIRFIDLSADDRSFIANFTEKPE